MQIAGLFGQLILARWSPIAPSNLCRQFWRMDLLFRLFAVSAFGQGTGYRYLAVAGNDK